jgi:hypothetical protein
MMWLFIFFLWVFAAALFSLAIGKAIAIADRKVLTTQTLEAMELQFSGGAR